MQQKAITLPGKQQDKMARVPWLVPRVQSQRISGWMTLMACWWHSSLTEIRIHGMLWPFGHSRRYSFSRWPIARQSCGRRRWIWLQTSSIVNSFLRVPLMYQRQKISSQLCTTNVADVLLLMWAVLCRHPFCQIWIRLQPGSPHRLSSYSFSTMEAVLRAKRS